MNQRFVVTAADLDAALERASTPGTASPISTQCTLMLNALNTDRAMPDLTTEDLLDIAVEQDQRGPAATIQGIIEALRGMHKDDTTTAMLAALEHYHLPRLVECMSRA